MSDIYFVIFDFYHIGNSFIEEKRKLNFLELMEGKTWNSGMQKEEIQD